MLHQRGGARNVIEVHGTAETNHCTSCGKLFCYKDILSDVLKGCVPLCDYCMSPIKPDITFYGESLPEAAFLKATEEASRADLIIALGSSLLVQPAASFIDRTLDNNGKLIVVNNQPTPYDRYTDYLFKDLEDFCNILKKIIQ